VRHVAFSGRMPGKRARQRLSDATLAVVMLIGSTPPRAFHAARCMVVSRPSAKQRRHVIGLVLGVVGQVSVVGNNINSLIRRHAAGHVILCHECCYGRLVTVGWGVGSSRWW